VISVVEKRFVKLRDFTLKLTLSVVLFEDY
jgi:hypothetical protein